ncbi:MAG: methyltransferase domain-containing protein [Gammaproteobacteria bacterium]|nr:methyltransferase domain-containing protein [Gammaproteobacteria bacterium]MCP4474288.1 methyltransferase domain-containing protein [Gammaproteobacteria bacterium]
MKHVIVAAMNKEILTTADIANLFNRYSDHYETTTLLPQLTATGLLDRLALMQIAPTTIVDLGCGCGQLTQTLITRYPQATVIGIDLAFKPLQQAATRCNTLINADACLPPLANQSIDLILANLSFAWSPLEKLLQACQKLLSANGLLLFTTFGPDLLKTMRRDYQREKLIDMHDIGDHLIRLGFSDPVMESEYYQFRYAAHNKFAEEFNTLGLAPLVTLTSNGNLETTFEIIYGHAWAKMATDEDGTIAIPLSKIGRRQRES